MSEDFNAFVQENKDKGFEDLDAFVFAGWEFVLHVSHWSEKIHCPMPEFIFESSNKKQQKTLREVLSEYNLPEPIFRKKQEQEVDPLRTVVALQAADFLAYEILRGWKDYLNVGHPTRPYLEGFDRLPHPMWNFIDKEKFDMLIPVSATIRQLQKAMQQE